jgi:methylated-DNA-protein-cysteine methyltransferase-like protein
MTEFTQAVISIVRKIPRGRIATYGQIAKLAGNPQGVRGVVWILKSSSSTQGLPWHRVVNAQGKISFSLMSDLYLSQKRLLQEEEIPFDADEKIDLDLYQWKKRTKKLK